MIRTDPEWKKRGPHPMLSNLYPDESLKAPYDKLDKRKDSEVLNSLKNRLDDRLRDYSGLTPEAIEVVLLQFADDFMFSRRGQSFF